MGLPFINSHTKKCDQIIAIDLGGRTTKAVHLQRRGDKLNFVNYAIVDAPVYDKGFNAQVLSEHLKGVGRSIDAGKFRQVTVALGVNETLFKQVELPAMPVADMRQMLKFNSKNYLQQDLPDYVFDCYVIAASGAGRTAEAGKGAIIPGNKVKVMVGGVKRQIVETLHTAIREAGLIPEQVIPGMIGPANAFEMAEPEIFGKDVIALVDIGFRGTSITVLNGGEIVLNRVVAIGGDRLTGGLAESLGISYTEAENIKVGMPNEVQQNLEPLIQPLGRELRASIDYFENHADKTVSQVFVSGGSARSEFIIQALQAELMVTCRSWMPTRFLQLALPPERMGEVEQVAPQLTVAIGAAVASF